MTSNPLALIQDLAGILLDAHSPRQAASRTLQWLLADVRARSIALWRAEPDARLSLELGIEVDQVTLTNTDGLWQRRGPGAFRESISDTSAVLIPTRGFDDSWAYVDGVDPMSLDADKVADGAAVAVKAVRRGPATMGRLPRDLRREELIATLHLHEWNIARVARVKGVTRKTIYDWLAKYDIPREHIPK
jgi:DNA-binding NtrC family response regulator